MSVFTHRELPGAHIITPTSKRLDASVAVDFRSKALAIIEVSHLPLVLDLAQVEFIDSSGLGVFVSLMKAVDGRIALCNVGKPVMQLVTLTRMDKILAIVTDEAAALHKVGAAP